MARARGCVIPGGPRLLAGSGFEGLFVFVGTQGMFLYVHMADLAMQQPLLRVSRGQPRLNNHSPTDGGP